MTEGLSLKSANYFWTRPGTTSPTVVQTWLSVWHTALSAAQQERHSAVCQINTPPSQCLPNTQSPLTTSVSRSIRWSPPWIWPMHRWPVSDWQHLHVKMRNTVKTSRSKHPCLLTFRLKLKRYYIIHLSYWRGKHNGALQMPQRRMCFTSGEHWVFTLGGDIKSSPYNPTW